MAQGLSSPQCAKPIKVVWTQLIKLVILQVKIKLSSLLNDYITAIQPSGKGQARLSSLQARLSSLQKMPMARLSSLQLLAKAIQPFFTPFSSTLDHPFCQASERFGSIPSPVPWQHLHTLASKSMAIQPSIVQKLLCLGPRLALVELCQLGSSLQGLKVPGTTAGPTGLI